MAECSVSLGIFKETQELYSVCSSRFSILLDQIIQFNKIGLPDYQVLCSKLDKISKKSEFKTKYADKFTNLITLLTTLYHPEETTESVLLAIRELQKHEHAKNQIERDKRLIDKIPQIIDSLPSVTNVIQAQNNVEITNANTEKINIYTALGVYGVIIVLLVLEIPFLISLMLDSIIWVY